MVDVSPSGLPYDEGHEGRKEDQRKEHGKGPKQALRAAPDGVPRPQYAIVPPPPPDPDDPNRGGIGKFTGTHEEMLLAIQRMHAERNAYLEDAERTRRVTK